MQEIQKRPQMIANGWIQAAGLVLLVGFFIMGVLTYYTYNDEPPFLRSSKMRTVWSSLLAPTSWRVRVFFWRTD